MLKHHLREKTLYFQQIEWKKICIEIAWPRKK